MDYTAVSFGVNLYQYSLYFHDYTTQNPTLWSTHATLLRPIIPDSPQHPQSGLTDLLMSYSLSHLFSLAKLMCITTVRSRPPFLFIIQYPCWKDFSAYGQISLVVLTALYPG